MKVLLEDNDHETSCDEWSHEIFSLRKTSDCCSLICNSSLERVEQFKYLGVVLDPLLNFKCHVDMICSKVSKKLGVLKCCKLYIDCNTMKTLYKSIVIPHFDYCDTVYDACGKGLKDRLQRLQNRGLRLLSQKPRTASAVLHAEAKECAQITTEHIVSNVECHKIMN